MRRRNLTTVQFAVVLLTLAMLVGSCSEKKKSATRKPSTTTTTTASGPATTATPKPTAAPDSGSASVWTQDAAQYRGQNGTTYQLDCTPGGPADTVWGSGTYTDDSSICTAAVQSGLITLEAGGKVTYQIAPGQESYDAGLANGVTSVRYARWDGSFTFPDAPPGSVTFATPVESWARNLSDQRGNNGTRVTIDCSPNGQLREAWGSGPYTDDSSVCTAAVHAGLITTAKGGAVVAEVAAGQPSYSGSTANGVTTNDYGAFEGSFTFPTDQKAG